MQHPSLFKRLYKKPKQKNMKSRVILLLLLTGLGIQTINAQVTRKFNQTGFTGIKNSTSADVYITQADAFSVEVTAKENVFKYLEIYVENNILHCKSKGRPNFWGNDWEGARINISIPNIELLSINGSGNMIIETPINSTELAFAINGSGDIVSKSISAKTLKASINGSGDIEVKDKSNIENVEVRINGSGDVNLAKVDSENANVRINGSGDVAITCNKNFNARSNGSGDIILYGKAMVDAKINGSGELIRKE